MSNTTNNLNNTLIIIAIIISLLLCVNIIKCIKNNCYNLNEPLVVSRINPSAPPEGNLDMILLNNDQLKELNTNNCPVCFDKIENKAIKTPCNHYFHQECLDEWIVKNINKPNQNCPICRFEFNINNNIEFPVEIDVT